MNVLGSSVNFQGEMAGNGDFTIQATAQINLGDLTGSASFTLSDTHARGFSFTAVLNAGFSSEYLRGNVDVDFAFGVADGNITYAGRVDVSGQVYLSSLFGWKGSVFPAAFPTAKSGFLRTAMKLTSHCDVHVAELILTQEFSRRACLAG